MKKEVIILLILIFSISLVFAQEGACIFEEDLQKNCKILTFEECDLIENSQFHSGILCTSSDLDTICTLTSETICIEGKNEVYFKDSCGNLANIYDADKINDLEYWKTIISKEESCNSDIPNKLNKDCGNCDYDNQETCKIYLSDEEKPTFGDYLCKDLNALDSRPSKDEGLEKDFDPSSLGDIAPIFDWKNFLFEIVIGLVVIIMVVLVLIYFYKKRKSKKFS